MKFKWALGVAAVFLGLPYPAAFSQKTVRQEAPSARAKQKDIVERQVEAVKLKKEGPTAADKAKAEFAGKRRPEGKLEDPMDRNRAAIDEKQKLIESRRVMLLGKIKDIYDRVVAQGGDPKKEADLLHRMAEYNWDSARYHYFQARYAYEQAMEAHLAGKGPKPEEPKPDYSKAMELYRKLLREHPNYERIGEVIYYLGDGLRLIGKDGDAAPYFQKLVKNHENSKYVSDALLGLAEYFFKSDLLFAARDTYKKIIDRFPQSKSFNYALYKLGWTYYNLGGMEPANFRNAIETFKKVIGGLDQMKNAEKSVIEFRGQALKDLVIAYAAVPTGTQECKEYFTARGGQPLAVEMLDRLAKFYLANDKDEEAIGIFRWFIELEPNSPKVVEWVETILDSIKKIGKPERIEKEMLAVIDRFQPKSAWQAANSANAVLAKKARDLAEGSLEFLASNHHQEAQRLKKDDLYRKAAGFYRQFFETFPDSPKAYRSRFFLAEILFLKLDKPEEAADHYHEIVKQGPAVGITWPPDKKKGETEPKLENFLADAAYGRISCFNKLMQADRNQTKTGGTFTYTKVKRGEKRTVQKREIPKWELKFVEASDEYVKLINKPDDAVPVMYNAAEIFFYNNHYEDAVKRYAYIVDNYPKSQFALYAANNILESYNRVADWVQIEAWAKRLRDNPQFTARPKKELDKFIALAIFNRANELRRSGDRGAAAEELLRLQREQSKSDLSDEALFSAASLYSEGKKHDKAIDTFKKLLAIYPKSKNAKQATFLIGAMYDNLADFPNAAVYFEKRAAYKDTASKDSKNSLFNAALIRHALGELDQALALYAKYMKRYPKAEDNPMLMRRIAEIHEKRKDWGKALAAHKAFFTKYKKSAWAVRSHLKSAQILEKQGKTRQAEKAYALVLKLGKAALDEASATDKPLLGAWMAEARSTQIDDLYKEYKDIKLRLPQSVMVRTIKQKAEKLKEVTEAYEEILTFKNGDRSACALWRIGRTYQEFSTSLMEAPIPKGLTPDEEQVYKIALQEKALPVEEKAFAAFAQALKLAAENNVFNDCVQKAGEALARAKPEEYPAVKEELVKPGLAVESLSPTPVMLDAKPKAPTTPAAAKPVATTNGTKVEGAVHASK